jgi:helicase required for RNAi-mediated heterochromatin assembly 1
MADSLSRQEANAANMILQQHIYKTYENQAFPQEWRNLPEVPSKAEICPPNKSLVDTADADQEDNWDRYQKEPLYDQNLPRNIVDGPWPSKEAYLGAHYQILREDAIAPLRRAVSEFKKCPLLVDDTDICVYKDVRTISVASFILSDNHRRQSRD